MKIAFLDSENWREIVATLSRNRTRTFLTAFGIFWGVAMLCMLLGGAEGLRGVMMRNVSGISTNMGGVFPGRRTMSYEGFNKGTSWAMTTYDIANVRRSVPSIAVSSTLSQSSASIVNGAHAKRATIIAVEPEYIGINSLVIHSGRFINRADEAACRKVVVLGRNLVNEIFPGEDPIGKTVTLHGISFSVVGVASQLSEASIGGRVDDSAIIPAATMHAAIQQSNNVYAFVFVPKDGYAPKDVFPMIRHVISPAHMIHPNDVNAYYTLDVAEQFEQINMVFIGINILAIFVGLSSLLAGIIGVGNIMWIVVKERTNEFGIRRAIGAKPFDITLQVLSEAVVLTLIAGLLGICFAAGVLSIADKLTAVPMQPPTGFQLKFGVAIAVLCVFTLLGAIAGTVPALKTMKIKPVEAMRAK